jgi:hypothetical protein
MCPCDRRGRSDRGAGPRCRQAERGCSAGGSARQRRVPGLGRRRARAQDARSRSPLPAASRPHRRRRCRPAHPPGVGTTGPPEAWLAIASCGQGGLGRRGSAVRPGLARLRQRHFRRRLRATHRGRGPGPPALRGDLRRRRRRARDAESTPPTSSDRPSPARLAGARRGVERVRPARRQVPRRRRSRCCVRDKGSSGCSGTGGVRGLERRLREARRSPASRACDDVLRPSLADLHRRGPAGRHRGNTRPRRFDGEIDWPAPSFRGPLPRRRRRSAGRAGLTPLGHRGAPRVSA